MTPAAIAVGAWLRRLRRGLALLCCLLTLTAGAPPGAGWASSASQVPLESSEGEESPVNDESEDGKDGEQGRCGGEEEDAARHARSRRLARGGDHASIWLAHLPHHHGGITGYTIPVCSPFERGALLPLRC